MQETSVRTCVYHLICWCSCDCPCDWNYCCVSCVL